MEKMNFADDAKSIFVSKTFWANIVGLAAVIIPMTGYGLPPEIATPEAQAQVVGFLMALANIVLRVFTTEPVKLSK